MQSPDEVLERLTGHKVVIDVVSQFVYLGELATYDHKYVTLVAVDVHDLRDTNTTRENYIVDAKRLGIRMNRERVYVRIAEIVSISALDDVVL